MTGISVKSPMSGTFTLITAIAFLFFFVRIYQRGCSDLV
jgi:hypothetical protein